MAWIIHTIDATSTVPITTSARWRRDHDLTHWLILTQAAPQPFREVIPLAPQPTTFPEILEDFRGHLRHVALCGIHGIAGAPKSNITALDSATRARRQWEWMDLLDNFLLLRPEYAGPAGRVLLNVVESRSGPWLCMRPNSEVTYKHRRARAFVETFVDELHHQLWCNTISPAEYADYQNEAYALAQRTDGNAYKERLVQEADAIRCIRAAAVAWEAAEDELRVAAWKKLAVDRCAIANVEARATAAEARTDAAEVRAAAEELPTCHGTFLRLSKSLETLSVQGGSTPCRAVVVWRPQSWGALPAACVLEVCDFLCVKALGRLGVCGRKCLGGAFREPFARLNVVALIQKARYRQAGARATIDALRAARDESDDVVMPVQGTWPPQLVLAPLGPPPQLGPDQTA